MTQDPVKYNEGHKITPVKYTKLTPATQQIKRPQPADVFQLFCTHMIILLCLSLLRSIRRFSLFFPGSTLAIAGLLGSLQVVREAGSVVLCRFLLFPCPSRFLFAEILSLLKSLSP